jgi:hypothetical protein
LGKNTDNIFKKERSKMKSFKEIRKETRIKEAYFDKGGEVKSLPNNAKAVKSIKLPKSYRNVDGDEVTFHDDGVATYMTVKGASQNSPPYKFGKKLGAADYAKAANEYARNMFD